MDWIELAQWVAAAVGLLMSLAAVFVGGMSWMLNHPD
jgi:hypothetical protein